MINSGKLAGLTVFVTGGSRGIGKAIALKAARDGANVVVAAKTAEPHPKLPGTIFTAVEEIEAAGGKGLPCVVDVRDENQVRTAVEAAVSKFGGIDIVINNASAISLTGTAETDMKRYDLMHQINTRGTFLVTKECLPFLKKSNHAHVLNISPPLSMTPHWFSPHVAYTMAKYGMSMCVLGMHDEFRPYKIGVNALWPRTAIHTAAIEMLAGSESFKYSRKPEIMADAAYAILIQEPTKTTGNFFIDDDVLLEAGVSDLGQYACDPSNKDNLMPDYFIEEHQTFKPKGGSKTEQVNEGKIPALFKTIESSLSQEVVERTKAVFQFNVTGQNAGQWFIDLKNGNGSCGKGEPTQPADATLTMDGNDFFDMFSGKLKPANAFVSGRLKIHGNIQKALKLEKLMSSLKSKL